MHEVHELNVGYGESRVIRDESPNVGPHDAVAVMGRNGMCKTPLLKSPIGLLPKRWGRIRLTREELTNLPNQACGPWHGLRAAGANSVSHPSRSNRTS